MKKLLVLLIGLLLFAFPVRAEITAASQLNAPGIKVGVDQGSAAELAVRELLPKASVSYFTDKIMGFTAVAQGKIDAFVFDKTQMELAIESGQPGVHLLDENLGEAIPIAVGLSPVSGIPDLKDQVNRFIAEMRADGTLKDMYTRWVINGNESMPQIDVPSNTGLRLKVGTSGIVPPYSYYKDGALNGYDIELGRRFAAWLGADVEFRVYDYGAIISAAITGDVDCVMANLNMTPERQEALAFSDILYEDAMGIMVKGETQQEAEPAWKAYNGKRLGVLTGTLMEKIAYTQFPDSEYLLLNSYPDCITALLAGRIDAFLGDEPGLKSVRAEEPKIDYIRDPISRQDYSFAFRKNDPKSAALCAELNAYLALCHQNGTIQELDDIWFGVDEERKVVDMSGLTGENGTIRVVTTSTDIPFSYIKEGKNVGYDIDLVVRFCRYAGYNLELGDVDFAGRIPAIESGKYDFTTDMNVTPEREEQVLFCDATSSGNVVLAVLASELAGISAEANGSVYNTLDQLNGQPIGVQTGQTFDAMITARLPKASLVYYNNKADLINALTTGKIAGFAMDEPVAKVQIQANDKLTYVPEYLDNFEFGYVFAKDAEGAKLRDQMNEFLQTIQADGTLAEIDRRWFSTDDADKTLADYSSFPAPNGILRVATEALYEPFSYIRNNEIVGYDIDIIVRFCEAYGYGLKIEDMNFSGILPSVQSGKSDIGCAGITITAERAESVYFSDPNYSGGTVMMVLKTKTPQTAAAGSDQNESFWDGLVTSFNKTFIRESRWKLFLEGVGITMLITLLSILFGTALGFLVFMLCRNGNRVANGVTRFCIWLVTGTPMVVLLMILYYIIFGSVAISGIAVAVIGFTLTFGAAVFGLLRMGVGTIERGQYEAAYALGHSNRHTFFRIILPQAIPHVLPAYQGEIVSLIKATAIVGYIAVQDLTKMGDIVRSRTYEAFFPLIAVTVIYFVLEGLFGFAVSRIRISVDPRKRKPETILRGIDPQTAEGGGSFVSGDADRNTTGTDAAKQRILIQTEHLKKEYPNVTPLKDVNVEIHDGDVISLIGPSGTGKSTLLRCINQLEKPTSGKVWVDGAEITDKKCDISKVRQKMGMVFQSFNLFGHLTVIENIMLSPVDLLGKGRQEAYEEGMRLLRIVGLSDKALNYPDELSGGQKQRIAIARTLAMDPDVILLDEPTSALDPTMVGEVQAVIRDLAKTGKTMMIVTHEMNFARAISNRVFYMDEGGIYEEGSPEQIFEQPQRENTRRFIRKLKVLELNIENREYDFPGMVGQIEAYCIKNQIAPILASRIQLVFEETTQTLLPIPDTLPIRAVCEYSEASESAEWLISYGGEKLDLTRRGDDLAYSVLSGMTEGITYEWLENAEQPNRLHLKIHRS